MSVRVLGDVRAGVAEALRDDLDVRPGHEVQGGAGVPGRVQPPDFLADAYLLGEQLEAVAKSVFPTFAGFCCLPCSPA